MPTARVMEDWTIRLKYGNADPYRYYGVALGLWDRLEFHGQFTGVSTIEAFIDEGYGHYKDRSAGARLVLMKENEFWPQVAIGIFDATGTALFGSRYLVASKMVGDVDLTLGLGQGILAGEFVGSKGGQLGVTDDAGNSFLLSDPFRKTRPFGGIEWQATPDLTFSVEFTPIDYQNMFGFRTRQGDVVKEDDSLIPISVGFKYTFNDFIYAQAALLRGNVWAGGVGVEFPLDPEGMLPWEKVASERPGERLKWQAFQAANAELSRIIAKKLKREGFDQVAVSAGETVVWIEARNPVHLSDSRALGHIAFAAEPVLPPRISTIYLNLKQNGQILQSLCASRENLKAFLASRQDRSGFLTYADFDLYGSSHWREFQLVDDVAPLYREPDTRLSWSINPRIRTFVNNRSGFLKHKGVLQARGNYDLWRGARMSGELELTMFNQFDTLTFNPLEKDSVRTDLALYDAKSEPRISVLALDQVFELPYNVLGRMSGGLFESAYAGFGAEAFRFFDGGLWGIGLESQAVRKRSLDDNFELREDLDQWFTTAFINLYAQIWPSQGLDAGLKIGRFLAGDPGVRIELRRSFRYFTIGAWYTVTDTSRFTSPENQDAQDKGVYIRIPFSIFRDHDSRGHFRYDFTSFTRDQGALVRQPNSLYPMDPWSTPVYTKQTLEEMRIGE